MSKKIYHENRSLWLSVIYIVHFFLHFISCLGYIARPKLDRIYYAAIYDGSYHTMTGLKKMIEKRLSPIMAFYTKNNHFKIECQFSQTYNQI